MKRLLVSKITYLSDEVSLKTKIMVIFFTLIIIPLSIFTVVSINKINDLMLSQTESSAKQSFNECRSILDRYFSNMYNAMHSMLYDEDIYGVATQNMTDYTPVHQIKDWDLVFQRFAYVKSGVGLDNIRFFVDNDSYFSENNVNVFKFKRIIGSQWYNNLTRTNKNNQWLPPSQPVDILFSSKDGYDYYSYVSILYNPESLIQPIALLSVDIQSDRIYEELDNASVTENSFVMLCNDDGIICSTSKEDNKQFEIDFITSNETFTPVEWQLQRINDDEYFITIKELSLPKWHVISVVPYRDISVFQSSIRNQLLILVLILAVISYGVAYITSRSSINRLIILNQEMKKIEQGSLDVSLKPIGNDEIGGLMRRFNNMAAQMSNMVEETYELGQKMKTTELRALQAQINPHFLYNSLDLINCLAIEHHIPEINQMVMYLAKFYKLCLSRGKDIISLRDETMHVELYVKIQNLRFDNKIKLIFDLDVEVYEYTTLKTVLQPIVENSIIHGIFEKDIKAGTIIISGRIENNEVHLAIEDDGVGISEERLEKILQNDESNYDYGYGVKNTNSRIQLYYGQQYGLFYNSILGKGTKVEIRFPAKKYE
jgi:two-component system sensor histidine kinase YesM